MSTQSASATAPRGLGATSRRDWWWVSPLVVVVALSAFGIYSLYAILVNADYEYTGGGAYYVSPFYSPNVETLFGIDVPFSAALLVAWMPLGLRLTCYYYRKAYYRSIWLDPVACAVGEPRKSYWGENSLPLILWNVHRYFLYAAIVFVFLLGYDGVIAHMFPVNADGTPFVNVKYLADGVLNPAFNAAIPTEPHHHVFGMSLVSLILILNPILLAGYTFGCHSLRHIVGGRKDCFAGGAGCGNDLHFKAWSFVSLLNRHHALFAMASLVVVGLADVIVRLVAMGKISDFRFF